MNSIKQEQDRIFEEFDRIGDPFDQYAYLIELSCNHAAMDENSKTPDRLVEGCQSSVWLDIQIRDGSFFFRSDSDTLIIKGVLSLLERVLCGQPCSEVAEAKIDFLQRTLIMATFEADRQKGIGYVISTLQNAARVARSAEKE